MRADFTALGLLLLSGLLIGLLFDFYRMLRRAAGWQRLITFGCDLLFSGAAFMVLAWFSQRANFLELRFFLFFGSLLGLALYLCLLSRPVKKALTWLFAFLAWLGRGLKEVLEKTARAVFQALRFLMAGPYSILRWLGLLCYRIGEEVFRSKGKGSKG